MLAGASIWSDRNGETVWRDSTGGIIENGSRWRGAPSSVYVWGDKALTNLHAGDQGARRGRPGRRRRGKKNVKAIHWHSGWRNVVFVKLHGRRRGWVERSDRDADGGYLGFDGRSRRLGGGSGSLGLLGLLLLFVLFVCHFCREGVCGAEGGWGMRERTRG